jgi:hypothetical protein
MDDKLREISAYLRGQRLNARTDDPRQWADYLDQIIQPKLDELEQMKAKKAKAAA